MEEVVERGELGVRKRRWEEGNGEGKDWRWESKEERKSLRRIWNSEAVFKIVFSDVTRVCPLL